MAASEVIELMSYVVQATGGLQEKPLPFAEAVQFQELIEKTQGKPRDVLDMNRALLLFTHQRQNLVTRRRFIHGASMEDMKASASSPGGGLHSGRRRKDDLPLKYRTGQIRFPRGRRNLA